MTSTIIGRIYKVVGQDKYLRFDVSNNYGIQVVKVVETDINEATLFRTAYLPRDYQHALSGISFEIVQVVRHIVTVLSENKLTN